MGRAEEGHCHFDSISISMARGSRVSARVSSKHSAEPRSFLFLGASFDGGETEKKVISVLFCYHDFRVVHFVEQLVPHLCWHYIDGGI